MIPWRTWYLAIPVVVFAIAILADAIGLPAREIGSVLILAVGPGAAITWLVGVRDRGAWLALVVPVSLAVDLIVATTLLYVGIWSATLTFAIICLITVIALALVPFERGARVALIVLALLPGALLVAAEIAPDPATVEAGQRTPVSDRG
jgi:hypothetical protein